MEPLPASCCDSRPTAAPKAKYIRNSEVLSSADQKEKTPAIPNAYTTPEIATNPEREMRSRVTAANTRKMTSRI